MWVEALAAVGLCARRPKTSKLAANDALRQYVQDHLAGPITSAEGATVAGPEVPWIGRDDLAAVAATLNRRPRKALDWKTPAEALNQQVLCIQRGGVATTP